MKLPQYPDEATYRCCIDFNGGVAIAEMLGRTNYMALVGGGKQPKFPQHKVGRPVGSNGVELQHRLIASAR